MTENNETTTIREEIASISQELTDKSGRALELIETLMQKLNDTKRAEFGAIKDTYLQAQTESNAGLSSIVSGIDALKDSDFAASADSKKNAEQGAQYNSEQLSKIVNALNIMSGRLKQLESKVYAQDLAAKQAPKAAAQPEKTKSTEAEPADTILELNNPVNKSGADVLILGAPVKN